MKTTLWFLIVLGGTIHVSADSFAQSMYLSPDTTRWTAPKSAETPADALTHQPTSRALTNIEEFGIGEDVLWFQFNEAPEVFAENPWLELRNPHLDFVDVFYQTTDGTIIPLGTRQGDDFEFSQRSTNLRYFIFELPSTSRSIQSVWVRVESTTARSVPLYLSSTESLLSYLQWRTLADGVFCGLVLVLAIYSFIALSTQRQPLIGPYLLFLCGITLFHFSLWGYGYQWLWPLWPTLQKLSPIAGMSFTAIGLNSYVARFIGIRPRSGLGIGVSIINILWLLLTLASANLNMLTISLSATAASIGSSLILGAMVLYHVLSRKTAAVFISIAFGPFVVSAVAFSMHKLGWFEFPGWIESVLPVSTIFQASVLAYGIQAEQQRVRVSQAQMSMDNLNLQDQLTLESLSRLELVGSVMHELNNPLNFISTASRGLLSHGRRLSRFRDSVFPKAPDDTDAKFLYDELNTMLSNHHAQTASVVEGQERATAILAQLRELAELSPQAKREIDLCSLLDPVLSTLNNHDETLLHIDYQAINQDMPPTLKSSPFILVHSLVRLSRLLIEAEANDLQEVVIVPRVQGFYIQLEFRCPDYSGSKSALIDVVEQDETTDVIRRWFLEQGIKWHLEVAADSELIWTIEFKLVGNSPTMPVLSLPKD